MLSLLFATTAAFAVQEPPRPIPPVRSAFTSYEDIVRCAGLTQAASEMEGAENADGKAAFDAALYWALTAGQAAQAAGKSGDAADADQTRARIAAVAQLNARNADARADLDRCRARTPNLG